MFCGEKSKFDVKQNKFCCVDFNDKVYYTCSPREGSFLRTQLVR